MEYEEVKNLVLKFYPQRKNENDPLIIKLATICTNAKCTSEEIEDLCDNFSDELDNSFSNGINSHNL